MADTNKCVICGNKEIYAKTETPHGNKAYCHECFLSIQQTENLLHDHFSRMTDKIRKVRF